MLGFVLNSLGFAGILAGPAGNWEKLRICWENLRICWEKFRMGLGKSRIGWEKCRICNQKAENKLGLRLEMVGIRWDSVESVGFLPVIAGSPHARNLLGFLRFCLGFSRIAWGVLRFVGELGRILYVPFYS